MLKSPRIQQEYQRDSDDDSDCGDIEFGQVNKNSPTTLIKPLKDDKTEPNTPEDSPDSTLSIKNTNSNEITINPLVRELFQENKSDDNSIINLPSVSTISVANRIRKGFELRRKRSSNYIIQK